MVLEMLMLMIEIIHQIKPPNKVRSDGRVIDSDDLSLIDDAKNGKFTCV